ncbi:hypothetical protein ACY3NT_002711 [Enterobacter sichuanensis]
MTNKNLPGGRLRPGRSATSARLQRSVKLADDGVKISDLPPAGRLLEDEVFPLVQDGETRKATLGQVRDLIPSGEEGASAYEIWLDEGFEGTEADFLDWLRGEDGQDGQDGNPGQDGRSAYQIWLAAGNEGSEQEFLASLKGEAGTDGGPGQEGKSAYQIWLDAGNSGTEDDFIASLKGEPGAGVSMLLVNGEGGQVTAPESTYDGTVFIGYGTSHNGADIGEESTDNRSGSVAIGMGAAADVVAVAVGRNARGRGNHSVAVGTEAEAKFTRAVAVGYRSQGHGDSCVAIGEKARVTQDYSVSLGENAYAAYRYSVALGAGSRAFNSNEVSIGYQQPGSKYPATRRLAGVSDGVRDNDAVTVKQLNDALKRIAELEEKVNGGS